ncbi:hypothetical protein PCO31010_03927 [Pandoraea commovens]|uniref:Uncharacterized protein n=1 Tax=Pandoraea commovens TaxID=2508289 RepID=A0A5E4XII9_9BURK|nr:hypothetical protein PCO31010_03927 [Pandoraea commovens]
MALTTAHTKARVMPRKNSISEKFADFALAIRLPTGGRGKTACEPRRWGSGMTMSAPALCTIE